jgi:hypothetical protein
MRDKYYTPSEDEIFNSPDLLFFENNEILPNIHIDPYFIRVDDMVFSHKSELDLTKCKIKFLDKDDIESFQFTYIMEEEDTFKWGDCYKLNDYEIHHLPDKNKVHITVIDRIRTPIAVGIWKYQQLFSGTIKNKSELKTVLKMIGVL